MKKTIFLLAVLAFCTQAPLQAQWQNSGLDVFTLGKVGIGTNAPLSSFHLVHDYGGAQFNPPTSSMFKLSLIQPNYSSRELFNIMSNGRVAVNHDQPNDWLHISHDDDERGLTLDMSAESSSSSRISFASLGQDYWNCGMDWGRSNFRDFYISRSGATFPDLYINPDGQVGIGTTQMNGFAVKLQVSGGDLNLSNGNMVLNNSSHMLISGGSIQVKNAAGQLNFKVFPTGHVRARQIVVDLYPIPDYVFENNYPLMPMESLAAFIQKHKHLPGIPSAAEYEARGELDLRELEIKLLQKVEELTLYLLQVKEENHCLQAELLQLQAQLNLVKQAGHE